MEKELTYAFKIMGHIGILVHHQLQYSMIEKFISSKTIKHKGQIPLVYIKDEIKKPSESIWEIKKSSKFLSFEYNN